MITWIEKALATAIHDRQLAEHSGTAGVRDETLLESALARPQQLYAYGDPAPDLAELAVTLAYGIAKNHPFVDGNKRTAAVCCETFIALNGGELNATDAELFPRFLALAEGELSRDDLVLWFRTKINSVPDRDIQEPAKNYQAST